MIKYKDDIRFIRTLADLYRVDGKYNKAIDYYSTIIDTSKPLVADYWKILYLRGICHEKLKQWKLAEKDFLYSLEINPNSPQVLNYLAYGWLERNKNFDRAIKMLQKAYKSNPNSYYIADSLGWAYFKKKQLKKALDLMERDNLMAPGEVISLDHLGDIYYALNRKREASFFWKQALDLASPDDLIVNSLNKKLADYYAG